MFEVSGFGVGGSFLFFSAAGVGVRLAAEIGCLLLLLATGSSGDLLWVSGGASAASAASGVSIPFQCTSSSPCACPASHPS